MAGQNKSFYVHNGLVVASQLTVDSTGNLYTPGIITSTIQIINGATGVTSTNTGALQVAGGAGIGGGLYVGGAVTATSLTLTAGETDQGTLVIQSTASSNSTNTGALVVAGGVGIGQNLYVNGTIYGNISSTGSVLSIIAGTDTAISTSTGAVTIWDTSTLQSVTNRGAATTNAVTFNNGATINASLNLTGSYGGINGLMINGTGVIVGTTQSTALYALDFQHTLAPISTTTINSYYGTLFLPTLGNTATYGAMYGAFSRIDSNANATSSSVTSWYGFYSATPNRNAASDVRFTNHTGFYAQDPSSITATNVYGMQSSIGAVSGINKWNLYASGTAPNYMAGSLGIGTSSFPSGQALAVSGGVTITGISTITNNTNATSTITGALIVAGGVGVGGTIFATLRADATSSATSVAVYYNPITKELTTATAGTGGSTFNGGTVSSATTFVSTVTITSTASSTSTTTGALQVTGGAGIGGNLYVGGNIIGGGVRSTSTSTAPTNPTVGDIWYNTLTDDIYRYTTDGVSSYWLDVTGATVSSSISFPGGTVPGAVSITNTTTATSTTTGALTVVGGVGIGSNIYAGGSVLAAGSSGPQLRFEWDTWLTNGTTALSAMSPPGALNGSAVFDGTIGYGIDLTTNSASQSGSVYWNSSNVNYTNNMILSGSFAGAGGTAADGYGIFFGSSAAISSSNYGSTNGILVFCHYYNGDNRWEVWVNGAQTNYPFIPTSTNYTPSGITVWSTSTGSAIFNTISVQINSYSNKRLLDVYLNSAHQLTQDITSWTPSGNYFGATSYTGGSYAYNYVRSLKVWW